MSAQTNLEIPHGIAIIFLGHSNGQPVYSIIKKPIHPASGAKKPTTYDFIEISTKKEKDP
jgi:hypothetical protein